MAQNPSEPTAQQAPLPASSCSQTPVPAALITAVEPYSPADDAGFEPGCSLTSVDGHPLRDIIDWRWYGAEESIEVGYVDLDGEAGTVVLEREPPEDWGFTFDGVVFDAVRQCRNACTFCFMRQLPPSMRPSLSLRDDDFRLSFLAGTFVTFTNMRPEDEARVIEQSISPLRMSLHAISPEVRRRLIGRHAACGIEVAERLLAAGIQLHVQIVLLPGENDGEELVRTLTWAYDHPGVLNVGIVPLGYTKHQNAFFKSFNDPAAAHGVIEAIGPFQKRARSERGTPWVFAADEFYRNAFGDSLLDHLPSTRDYGDFSMFEDGIGIIRSCVDEYAEALASGEASRLAAELAAQDRRVFYLCGFAMMPYAQQMVDSSVLADRLIMVPVANSFFGGNVDVTGLLTGGDIARAARELTEGDPASAAEAVRSAWRPADLIVVPEVVFNDRGLTLDDMALPDIETAAGQTLAVVSCSPLTYLGEIADLAR